LAENHLPTALLRYPLARRGERFPFVHPEAQGFFLGKTADPAVIFAAGLEGVAFIERLSYDLLAGIGLEVGPNVYVTGGGTRSALWSRLRASILGKTLIQPAVTETAMGAAILAASGCWHETVHQSAQGMVREVGRFEPEARWEAGYTSSYQSFVAELTRRDYL
jgi:xylulokinase